MTDKTESQNNIETHEAYYDSEGNITGYKTPDPKAVAELLLWIREWKRKCELEQLANQQKEK